MNSYLIGCDPELFAKIDDREFISGHDLIPGTKHSPFFVDKGAIQVDGVALEFNTFPAATVEEFQENIKRVVEIMTQIASEKFYKDEFLGDGSLKIVAEPTAYFEKEYFDGLPQTPKLLGCTPDYNAYTGVENEPPSTDEPFRTGSGHIHVGWTKSVDIFDREHFFECIERVKQLDCVLYPISLLWDSDTKRRELYGKIGAFRPKHFGVEYRPLSNRWVSDPRLQEAVFILTKWAMEQFDQGEKFYEHGELQMYIEQIRSGFNLEYHDIYNVIHALSTDYGFQPPKVVEDLLEEEMNKPEEQPFGAYLGVVNG